MLNLSWISSNILNLEVDHFLLPNVLKSELSKIITEPVLKLESSLDHDNFQRKTIEKIRRILLQRKKLYSYCWDTSTSSQVSNCDDVVREIYLDHKFQWSHEGLNCKALALGNYFVCKRFAVQTLLWSLKFVIQINLEQDTIAVILVLNFLFTRHKVHLRLNWKYLERGNYILKLKEETTKLHFHKPFVPRKLIKNDQNLEETCKKSNLKNSNSKCVLSVGEQVRIVTFFHSKDVSSW